MHDHLGMIFDFSKKAKVMANMIEYIKNIVANFPDEITMVKTSLAADHLFKVQEESEAKPLPEVQAMAFHHTTVQMLFLSTHARRDIQTATAFFMMQVKSPDEDN